VSLTNKQRVFVAEYLRCWNATEAARRAGYSERTARSIGAENLTKPDIQEEITKALAEVQMSADEALVILAKQARGDIGDFMDVNRMSFEISLADAKERGLTPLIRKVRQFTSTRVHKDGTEEENITQEIELYDAQAAAEKILRVAGKYKDSLDVTPIKVIVEYADGKASSAPPPSGAGQSEE
jgi:phage terminase small subunit